MNKSTNLYSTSHSLGLILGQIQLFPKRGKQHVPCLQIKICQTHSLTINITIRYPGKSKTPGLQVMFFPGSIFSLKTQIDFHQACVTSFPGMAKVFKFHQLANTRHIIISTLAVLVFNPHFSDDIVSHLKFKPKLLDSKTHEFNH